jgi:hypothetical protein
MKFRPLPRGPTKVDFVLLGSSQCKHAKLIVLITEQHLTTIKVVLVFKISFFVKEFSQTDIALQNQDIVMTPLCSTRLRSALAELES